MQYPKITIVTVCFNSAQYIEECLLSVLNQNYPHLEYNIIDGGSTDGTREIIERYRSRFAAVVFEPDNGPADALNKGFKKAKGEIMGWLNSDDRLHPGSLFAVAQIFTSLPQVSWMMGFPTWYNAAGACLNENYYDPGEKAYDYVGDNLHPKFARWSKWRFALGDYKSIQQESVFWRTSLWHQAGAHISTTCLGFDTELWTRFFEHAELYTAPVLIGGFRFHGNQLSFNQQQRYQRESAEAVYHFKQKHFKPGIRFLIRRLLAFVTKPFYYYEIPLLKKIYPRLLQLPPYIFYNVKAATFSLGS